MRGEIQVLELDILTWIAKVGKKASRKVGIDNYLDNQVETNI